MPLLWIDDSWLGILVFFKVSARIYFTFSWEVTVKILLIQVKRRRWLLIKNKSQGNPLSKSFCLHLPKSITSERISINSAMIVDMKSLKSLLYFFHKICNSTFMIWHHVQLRSFVAQRVLPIHGNSCKRTVLPSPTNSIGL